MSEDKSDALLGKLHRTVFGDDSSPEPRVRDGDHRRLEDIEAEVESREEVIEWIRTVREVLKFVLKAAPLPVILGIGAAIIKFLLGSSP